MRDYTVDFATKRIICTKGFYEAACDPTTDEHEEMLMIMEKYPAMQIVPRATSRKNKPNSYKGITYRYMRKFISVMDKENLTTFEEVVLLYEGLYTENATVFAAVRDWFLANYPHHKEMIVAAVPTRKAAFTSVPTVEETAAAA